MGKHFTPSTGGGGALRLVRTIASVVAFEFCEDRRQSAKERKRLGGPRLLRGLSTTLVKTL